MIASKIGTEDIINIGAFGRIEATLPDYASCESVKNLANRANFRYPRKDGLVNSCSIDRKTNTITIMVVAPEDRKRKNKSNKK